MLRFLVGQSAVQASSTPQDQTPPGPIPGREQKLLRSPTGRLSYNCPLWCDEDALQFPGLPCFLQDANSISEVGLPILIKPLRRKVTPLMQAVLKAVTLLLFPYKKAFHPLQLPKNNNCAVGCQRQNCMAGYSLKTSSVCSPCTVRFETYPGSWLGDQFKALHQIDKLLAQVLYSHYWYHSGGIAWPNKPTRAKREKCLS